MAGGAAEALADRVGPQLLLLRQEIAKAALFAGPGKPVGVGARERDRERRGGGADLVPHRRDRRGSHPRRARPPRPDAGRRRARRWSSSVLSRATSASWRAFARAALVQGSPFAQKKLESQARRYALPRLRACLHAIHDADERLKGRGALPAEITLERLVMTLGA